MSYITRKQIERFKKFLLASGAELLAPTNPYEVVRFKGNGQIGIIYCNGDGNITKHIGEATKAVEAFVKNKPYRAAEVKMRIKKNNRLNTLLKRDGAECFYCGKEIEAGEETIEHIFSLNQGGSNHISNLALAHERCNRLAHHLSVVEKVKLRDKLRTETTEKTE